MVNLFHVAVAKKKVRLIQQLLPYQNLSDKEKFSLIYQFMHTSHNFVLLLLKEIKSIWPTSDPFSFFARKKRNNKIAAEIRRRCKWQK